MKLPPPWDPALQAGDEVECDPSLLLALPTGFQCVRLTVADGKSNWANLVKVETREVETDSSCYFFMKIARGDSAKSMLEGEYEGIHAIYKMVPEFVPKPIAWGRYQNTPDTYFFVQEYIDMDASELPKAETFCSKLAALHKSSISPNRKFGFHVTTCNGSVPQRVDWEDSWEVFFAKGLRHMLELDLKVNGPQPDLMQAITPIFDRVIPRLLRPLEQGHNRIKPCLVHGDLWFGNTASRKDTGIPIIFDPAAFYAHSEYELGNWRHNRSIFKEEYYEAYLKHYGGPAEPKDEFEDRNLLYSL